MVSHRISFVVTPLCGPMHIIATPFIATLAAQGNLSYPLFGLSLTRNSSGTLAIGAIDSSVVKNVSNIGWNEVVPFQPFVSENSSSSYLQWVIRLSSIAVRYTVPSTSLTLNRLIGQWYDNYANADISQRYWQLLVGSAGCVRAIVYHKARRLTLFPSEAPQGCSDLIRM